MSLNLDLMMLPPDLCLFVGTERMPCSVSSQKPHKVNLPVSSCVNFPILNGIGFARPLHSKITKCIAFINQSINYRYSVGKYFEVV